MKKNPWLIVSGIGLIILLVFWLYYNNTKVKPLQGISNDYTTIKSSINQSIAFSWSDPEAMTGNTFSTTRQILLKELSGSSGLEIIGFYDVNETNTSDEINLGIARAMSIRSLFPEVADDRISISAAQRQLDSTAKYFKASNLNIVFGHNHPEEETDTIFNEE